RYHLVAQQIDILPTLLSVLGYDQPYVAFGKDLSPYLLGEKVADDAAFDQTWAVNYYNGIYQYVKGAYLLQYDGQKVRGLYNYDQDWMLTRNLLDQEPERAAEMEQTVKAIIQSYMQRMVTDNLVIK
ncbi:MAG: LTA synthase family protein, partial [Bacteroidales bacterium]|nr:LTA synthase family protein [Bacteroidales bacterium]